MLTQKLNVRKLVLVSFFIALQIILRRILSIQTPWLVISFNFLPLALCALIFGPLTGGLAASLADFIGVTAFPSPGASFFPGFTLTYFLAGAIYGLAAKHMGVTPKSMLLAVFSVKIGVNLIIDTYWIKILQGEAYLGLLFPRTLSSFILIPIQVILILAVWNGIKSQVPQHV